MAHNQPVSWVQRLKDHCAENRLDEPHFQDYSDPRGIRTAWSSGVFVNGKEYRAPLWRDYRFLDQCHEEAAEVALKSLLQQRMQNASSSQYYGHGYGTSR
ncbi:hypothetical protein BU24DRAFT_422119 [Aaosphaeria arxii CBS 175.79]|uniref:DRBM domain-containing protein n=1 Tax=Aaosphaeria arxii CBS 175.79 TaxID=1450172 RepID=A0A6A5XSD9_9PLEO|nr:uncharacterized protein BU24DRAFT_422119 [Aaosphaeria arxii CBS 175.79]KAF2015816.1 hypothetical protein BU24DRAFT_422119 [Aaosphaeria arxii CBS 175.79]